MTDYEAAYRGVRERVTTLLRDRPDAEVEQLAPGTPEWRVRDVVAHLGGVCDDIANGNMNGVATDPWTKAQVDKRRDWELARVLDDWTMHAGNVEPLLNDLGTPIGQMVFDAWTHEQDIRGALGEPGGRDSDAAVISFAWFCEVNVPMGPARAVGPERSEDSGSIEVVIEDGTFVLGGGERLGTLCTTRFEVLRAITGRRSREQVRALDFDGPPLDELIFANGFFTPAARDIVE